MFPAMIFQWRNAWVNNDLAFYYAQIAPWKYKSCISTDAAMLREVQQKSENIIPNSGMIVTLDLGDSIAIHSPRKKEVGERFGYLALGKTYHYKGITYQYPQFKSMKISNDTAIVELENVEDGIHSSGKIIKGFEIAGEDRVFKSAHVSITDKGTRLRISEPSINKPVAVRYGFLNYITASLFSNYELPLMQFRTDDWKE